MQLNVFSTDSQKSGFRLQYLEIFNWGTFDEYVHVIRPLGETSLLTGANGSGKTTFVDALLTLIVPEKKYRFYNQSSGSEKKGDRTEESYVLGGYGTLNSESTGATKTLYLRENKDEAYSILLANFANEAEQVVTLFQVRYFSNGDMKRVFGVAHKALHIGEDFRPFDLGGNWKRRIEQQYNKGSRRQVEWFDAAGKYALRLTDVLGMQSIQALSLFNQTVGIKVLGNLDDFIRTHMLEPRNMEEQFQELKRHLGTLLEAQRNIEKAGAQIQLLEPIQLHYRQFNEIRSRCQSSQDRLETARIWNGYAKYNLLEQALQEAERQWKDILQKAEAAKTAIEELIEKERVTKNQIEQNKAGQRLQQLEKDLQDLQLKKVAAEKNSIRFAEWCDQLHLEEKEPGDEAAYNRIVKEVSRADHRLDREKRLNEEDEFAAQDSKKRAVLEKQQLEEELNLLLQSRNNIPGYLVNLRKEICAALKIDPGELPFAGELMQVRPDEGHWQPALEKLLRPFALRLLVPAKHYKKLTRHVNQTHLGTRLVYYHVNEGALDLHPEKATVCGKLEFHPDHKLAAWVQQEVIRQFGYSCIEDERTLDRYDKAITLHGLVKSRDRHEKDDRPEKNDPGKYVMGWNNERKKEALIRRRDALVQEIGLADETVHRCEHKKKRLLEQVMAAARIREHGGFAEIDAAGIQRAIHKAAEQIKTLKKSSNQLNALTKQLDELHRQRIEAENERDGLSGKKTLLQARVDEMTAQHSSLQELCRHIGEEEKEALRQFQEEEADLLSRADLSNIDTLYRSYREKAEQALQALQEAMHKEENHLVKSISRIKNPSAELLQRFPDWLGDVQALPEEAAYAEAYQEWLDKLTHENLPRFKKDFESYISDTITYKIGGLNEEMEKWEREINNSVHKLNQSLAGINFNRLPDTYIQLGKRPVPDTTIKAFKARLLDALPQAANWQQSAFEEKASHFRQKVQPLIDSLDESDAFRSRVMDVRNWFEFWADEKFRNTGELKKTYRQMGQLSGGEKAQLTYTILCSAIAYQFGITREGKNSRSLRFIAVDESFSNQDEEKATYLMELCKQLHLQLLVVTPSDKIQIVQQFIAHVHLVQRVNNRHSELYNMTVKELQKKMNAA